MGLHGFEEVGSGVGEGPEAARLPVSRREGEGGRRRGVGRTRGELPELAVGDVARVWRWVVESMPELALRFTELER